MLMRKVDDKLSKDEQIDFFHFNSPTKCYQLSKPKLAISQISFSRFFHKTILRLLYKL